MKRIGTKTLARLVVAAALAAAFLTSNFMSLYVGMAHAEKEYASQQENEANSEAVERNILADTTILKGEHGNEIYTIETWEDGTIYIKTMQQYIHQQSDASLVITE